MRGAILPVIALWVLGCGSKTEVCTVVEPATPVESLRVEAPGPVVAHPAARASLAGNGTDRAANAGVNLVAFRSMEEFSAALRTLESAEEGASSQPSQPVMLPDVILPTAPPSNPTPVPSPAPSPVPSPAPAPAASSSSTMIQEAGVDEADKVKHDGVHFYIVRDKTLRIVSARPMDEMREVALVALPAQGHSLFLWDHKAAVLTQEVLYEYTGDGVPDPNSVPYGTLTLRAVRSGVTVVDVSDPAQARILGSRFFDGLLAATRRIGTTLHLVLQRPTGIAWSWEESGGKGLVPVLPHESLTVGGEGKPVVEVESIYHAGGTAEGDLTVVASMSLLDPAGALRALAIFDRADLAYMSQDALYIARGAAGATPGIRVHKVSVCDGGPRYAGTGSVPGTLLDSYSFGEYAGCLRLATRTGTVAAPSTRVTVLAERGGQLETVGSIEDIAPGETLDTARFLGAKGYLVTSIRRTWDPFFTLDLSDPANPRILGEVDLPGFSGRILPVSETAVVTFGRSGAAWSNDLVLNLFDVSDPAAPRLAHTATVSRTDLMYSWSTSEALDNAMALQWYPERRLLALPCSQSGYDASWNYRWVEEVAVFEVDEAEGFRPVTRLDVTRASDSWWFASNPWTRAIFLDDDVYALTRAVVVAVSLEGGIAADLGWRFDLR